jgi:hypothetical protein
MERKPTCHQRGQLLAASCAIESVPVASRQGRVTTCRSVLFRCRLCLLPRRSLAPAAQPANHHPARGAGDQDATCTPAARMRSAPRADPRRPGPGLALVPKALPMPAAAPVLFLDLFLASTRRCKKSNTFCVRTHPMYGRRSPSGKGAVVHYCARLL